MKKIASFFATIAAVAALSACSYDDSPVLQKPTEFKLNTPPFAGQLYQLTEKGTIQLTCSQPDYGVGVSTTYGVEISLTEDFADSRVINTSNPLSATIEIKSADVNLAILDMLGIVDLDTWTPFANDRVRPLYVRATAQAAQVEYSKITSNPVKLSNVEMYYAIPTPGFIYLIGSPNEWKDPKPDNEEVLKDWRLYESKDAIGSKVYTGVFDNIPANPVFRFYTALTSVDNGWDISNSIGCAGGPNDDKEVLCSLENGKFEGTLVANNKDKFQFPDFPGGAMTITVDLNSMKITVQAGAVEVKPTTFVYMCGNMASSDWTEPSAANEEFYNNWRLSCSDDSGVYSGTFNLENCGDTDLYCRFYKTLSGWGAAQWASPTGENYIVESGVKAPTAEGEGCFQLQDAKGKNVKVDLDTNSNEVTFTFVE